MEIRKDFQSVEEYLHRLVQYADAFDRFNLKDWPHYKNNEDFERIYGYDRPARDHFENLYSDGRDCAIALSDKLISFNYPNKFPTLTSFVKSFDGGWVYETYELRKALNEAKHAAESVDRCPWTVGQMLQLFEDQIELLDAVRNTLRILRETDLYKIENGRSLIETPKAERWWKNFDRRIAVFGLVVTIIGLAIAVLAP